MKFKIAQPPFLVNFVSISIEFASFQNLFKKSLNHSPHFPEAYIRSKEFYPQKFTHQFCPPESDGPDSGKNVQWASIDWQE